MFQSKATCAAVRVDQDVAPDQAAVGHLDPPDRAAANPESRRQSDQRRVEAGCAGVQTPVGPNAGRRGASAGRAPPRSGARSPRRPRPLPGASPAGSSSPVTELSAPCGRGRRIIRRRGPAIHRAPAGSARTHRAEVSREPARPAAAARARGSRRSGRTTRPTRVRCARAIASGLSVRDPGRQRDGLTREGTHRVRQAPGVAHQRHRGTGQRFEQALRGQRAAERAAGRARGPLGRPGPPALPSTAAATTAAPAITRQHACRSAPCRACAEIPQSSGILPHQMGYTGRHSPDLITQT